jgi:valyl-tRNA synthetase
MIRDFPVADFRRIDEVAEKHTEEMMEITRAVRNLRAEIGVPPGKPLNVLITSQSAEVIARLDVITGSVKPLARVAGIEFGESLSDEDKRQYASAHFVDYDLHVPMAGLIDIDKELARLGQELQLIEKELTRVSGKLSNEQFTSKAPAEVVEKERRILHELTDKKVKLEERLAGLRTA